MPLGVLNIPFRIIFVNYFMLYIYIYMSFIFVFEIFYDACENYICDLSESVINSRSGITMDIGYGRLLNFLFGSWRMNLAFIVGLISSFLWTLLPSVPIAKKVCIYEKRPPAVSINIQFFCI